MALALTLRLGWPGLVDFKLDEGNVAQKALDIARGREFPLDGVWSSRGIPTHPNMVYLSAVPFLVSDSPAVATAWVGLLGVAALIACYWLANRYFGPLAAALAMLLYAVSPWQVYFARRLMPISLLPLPVALTVVSGVLGFVEHRPRWQALHLILLALTVETHLSALSLVLLTAYLIAIARKRLNRRWLAIGAAIAAITTTPVWIVFAREYQVIAADAATGAERTSDSLVSPDALKFALANTLGTRFYPLAAPDAQPGEAPRADGVTPLLWAEGVWLAVSLAGLAWYAWRERATPVGRIASVFVVWALSSVAAYTVQWTAVYHHYFLPMMPAPYLAIGGATALGLARLRARYRNLAYAGLGLAVALALAIAGAQLQVYRAVMTFFATQFTPGDLGTPLGLKLQAARQALDMLEADGAEEIIVVGEGDRIWGYETAAVFEVLLDRAPHRFVTGSQAAVFPAGRAEVLIVPGEWAATDWYDSLTASRGLLPLREGEAPYRFFFADGGATLPPGFQSPQPPLRWDNGAEAIGYLWTTPLTATTPGELIVAWKIGAAAKTESDYHFAVYLQDASGQVWAQIDGASFPSDMWRPGDVVLNWFTLPPPGGAPPDPVNLRLAMYSFPDVVRVPVLGPDGRPASDAVQLGTLTLSP